MCKNTTVLLVVSLMVSALNAAVEEIVPGAPWHDESGALIQAHGGCILKHGDTWYWYGEDKRDGYFPSPGVSCYSSRDLINWTREGIACSNWVQNGESIVPNTPSKFQSGTQRAIIERPKVLYNEKTGRFVMWMHLEGYVGNPDVKYQFSSAGVAVADTPTGPFRYVDVLRPIPPELYRRYADYSAADQFERGSTFRDMTLFKDDDGTAYVVYAGESNYTMHIIRLTDDYCGVLEPVKGETWNRILVEEHREAPAMFKHDGKYYLITSGCKGWTPNPARLHVSDHIFGPYISKGNPCRGSGSELTFESQGTYVLPVDPEQGQYIFMADRWTRENIGGSRYVWLPFIAAGSDEVTIEWKDRWNLSVFDTDAH